MRFSAEIRLIPEQFSQRRKRLLRRPIEQSFAMLAYHILSHPEV